MWRWRFKDAQQVVRETKQTVAVNWGEKYFIKRSKECWIEASKVAVIIVKRNTRFWFGRLCVPVSLLFSPSFHSKFIIVTDQTLSIRCNRFILIFFKYRQLFLWLLHFFPLGLCKWPEFSSRVIMWVWLPVKIRFPHIFPKNTIFQKKKELKVSRLAIFIYFLNFKVPSLRHLYTPSNIVLNE